MIKNKIIIISGSSKGIGKGIAEEFLKKNNKVLINSRNLIDLDRTYKNLKIKYKNKILMVCGDIQKRKTLNNIKKIILKKWGRIDVLVANAGDINNIKNKDDFVKKNYNTTKKFIDFFYKNLIKSSGSIILISSIVSLVKTNAPEGFITSKKLIDIYGKKLSIKLAKYNINVNIISPGNIYFKNGNWFKKMKKNSIKTKKYINQNVPMKKFGTINDVSNLCIFLSSDLSKFITGQIIAVDGGQSIEV